MGSGGRQPAAGGGEDRRQPEVSGEAEELRRLRAIFAHSLDAVVLADDDGRYVDANPAAAALLGWSREELLGLTVADVTPAERRRGVAAQWEAFQRDGTMQGEYALRRRDGTRITVEFRAVANVLPGLHLSILRDVSERRRVEAELADTRAQLESIVGNAPVVVYAADGAGMTTVSQGRGLEDTGLAPGDAVGRRLTEVFGEAVVSIGGARVSADDVVRRVLGGESVRAMTEFRGQFFDNWLTPVRGGDGSIGGLMGVAMNVTSQERAAAALRESEERFRASFDGAPLAAAIISFDLRFLRVNQEFTRLTGYSEAELEALGVRDLVHPEDFTPATTELLLDRGSVRGLERRYRRRDGSIFPGRLSASLLVDRHGAPSAYLAMIEDVSERKRSEQRIASYQRRLGALAGQLATAEMRERRRLAGQLHDVLGPKLTVARLDLGQLARGLRGARRTIAGEAAALLEDAIRFTRSVTSALSSPVLEHLGLDAAIESLGERLGRQGVAFALVAEGDEPELEEDVRGMLFLVVQEALLNVAKHARAHTVTVRRHVAGGTLELVIEDDGAGFPVPVRGEAVPSGNGFGLLSMSERVRAAGGTVEIRSAPGSGTTLAVRVPLAATGGDGP